MRCPGIKILAGWEKLNPRPLRLCGYLPGAGEILLPLYRMSANSSDYEIDVDDFDWPNDNFQPIRILLIQIDID